MTVTILTGDARSVLATLPAQSVQCCVTSPPYYGLRDYGVDGQIGLEKTPDEYVAEMVAVFREVRRVLRDDGVLWLNLGDSYSTHAAGVVSNPMAKSTLAGVRTATEANRTARERTNDQKRAGIPEKNLIGIPWMVAFALRADGWYLRSEVIWAKPNPMPESVTDRPTKAHEQVFLLSKSPCYLYDAAAIAEPQVANRPQGKRSLAIAREKGLTAAHIDAIRSAGISDAGKSRVTTNGAGRNTAEVIRLAAEAKNALGGYYREFVSGETRNARSVWSITTKPFRGAHFATMPPDLAEKCVKAGSAEGDLVLDPFGGAGTTGLVAGRLGRNAVLVELSPGYVEITKARLTKEGVAWTGDGVAAALTRNRQARESLSAAMDDL